LDYNDCWLAAEWGHPSDNLGAILAVADWLSRTNKANGKAGVKMSEVITGMIQAHEVFNCMIYAKYRFKDVSLWKTVSIGSDLIMLSSSRLPVPLLSPVFLACPSPKLMTPFLKPGSMANLFVHTDMFRTPDLANHGQQVMLAHEQSTSH